MSTAPEETLVKTLPAILLCAAFGLLVSVPVHAQADNNAARIAMQKHNAKLSRKETKERNRAMRKARTRAMRKAMKSMGKSHPAHTSLKTSDAPMPS